ncbi:MULTISPECIES: hypothetical protein [Bradyrhizobium]|jgi:hypothetical protein|uniref:Uncharacterized protein n=1 Tax=Bradyrhizobium elkanii TaxID=29448 RepID=A0A8I2C182_BRAEL|nr:MULTISPECIES: hypothetical protein [Bradyrhizobium]MBP1290408.1 hypothetical protein [Bradyrhizobium elkanii]MBP2428966.1 hypothetical protein [Bradyrhizobium elkanii]MCP1972175.1 hypothetical protein [Bradyrhizobium elkanii]MCS3452437.1 hypothetical protein [Bradyrhizobium elkanii]MCS3565460.1 hypothetical protein [Bradyrhizobium elkanii]
MIKTLLAPIRAVTRFPLVQFAVVIFVIFVLQAADDSSLFGQIFGGLDRLVDETVRSVSAVFTVKSFTKSWLTFGFMIAYVYLAFWLMLLICGAVMRSLIDYAGRMNFLWSRNLIARSRGVAAYRAWLPLEKIRPRHIPQQAWEEQFAWPPNDRPPYLPLGQRVLRAAAAYVLIITLALVILQFLTPFHVLTWLGATLGYRTG